MNRAPLFIDAYGMTIRVNPRTSPGAFICLQIMEPPEVNTEGTHLRDARFTQIYLSKDHAKALADILHAEAVLDLMP